ncbi:hypothetical protein C0389_10005 [bacterium]|nr:hypothetical protein [bacterium]
MTESTSDAEKLNQIVSYLKNIEIRVSKLEAHLNIDSDSSEDELSLPSIIPNNLSERADSLENQIGQFWFAKIGIVILSIGIVFLLTFPYQNLPPIFPSLIGFVLVAVLFWLSNYLRTSFQYLSQYVFGGGLLLLYFTTLRLHYFGVVPAVENNLIEIIFLAIVTIVHLYISYRKKSIYLSSIGITLGCITTLISNDSYSVFAFSVLLSLSIVYLRLKHEWNGFYIYGIALIYITTLLWFINNPLLGNNVELRNSSPLAVLSILLLAIIFAFGNFFKDEKESENNNLIVSTILNCFLSYTLFLIFTVTKHKDSLALFHISSSIIYLIIATLYWTKSESKFSTFFYSIAGYTALSVAIVAQFPKPDFFVWLCWQSLLVVSTALWFRSKIIIVANFVMYLLIFISYLFMAGTIGTVTLSFGVVALITARILNWQKDRLDLKTEIMRLSYLAAAFFIFPYALYHIVPKDYVALSWTIVAIIYYVLSVVLKKNKKYRWMALLTFVLTVLYILFVGTSNLNPIYRIVSFIVLGLVLLAVSIFYGRVKSKSLD